MSWLQLTLDTDKNSAKLLSELLNQFGAISVSLSAASNEALYGEDTVNDTELWDITRITAQLHTDTDLDILLACIRNRVGAEKIIQHKIGLVRDRDWISEYKQETGPVIFGERLCICPSWCEPPENIQHCINLDPGLAFGTGSHETTSMCLDWLINNELENKQVIDYGCGSGILALAALELGAIHAYAIDIDPQAIMATKENARRNNANKKISVIYPDEIDLPEVDILMANILSGPLVELAPKFECLVKPGGSIILSGILAVQAEDCLSTYSSWFNMDAPRFQKEWAMLTGIRQ